MATIWKTLRQKHRKASGNAKHTTLRSVAAELEMGYGNLCDIENGHQLPTALTLAKLVKFYNLTGTDVQLYLGSVLKAWETKANG